MDMPMVWVISSDSDTRWLIRLNLSKRGLQIQEFSPQRKLAPSGAHPELIILEAGARDQEDWGVAREVRQHPGLREVPLILIAASAPTPSLLATLQPVRWVEKPLAMDALLSLVWKSLA